MAETGTLTITPNALLIPEILERVFASLDGVSLVRCTAVCKLWKQVEHNLYKFSRVWRFRCTDEIPKDVLLDIAISLYPSWLLDSTTTIDWKQIYKSWRQWHYLGRWKYDKQNEHLKQITCVKATGDCFVMGNGYGQILLWKTGFSPVCLGHHMRGVTDLALISFSEHRSKLLNQFSYIHDLVVSTSGDFTIQVNRIGVQYKKPIVLREHGAATVMVRVFQRVFAVLSEDEHISMWRLEGNTTALDVKKILNVRLSVNPFKAVSVWWCIDGIEAYGLLKSGHRIRLHKNLYQPYIPPGHQLPPPLVEGIKKFLIWRNRICIGINYLGLIFANAATSEYRQLSTFGYLDATPRVIHLHGEILLVGTEGGTIYLYRLKSENDLLTLDLSNYIWKHNVQRMEPIVAVDIQEGPCGKVIAASTAQAVFVLRLFHSFRSTQGTSKI